VRWHYRDAGLLWLFVPAYVVHLAEEWLAGFPAWIGAIVGTPLPGTAYLVINGTAFVLLVAGIRAAIGSEKHGWVAVAVATVALVNVAAHTAGAVLTGSYSPGLISAVLLYVPLGVLTMIRASEQATAQMAGGILAGVLIHAAVFAAAFLATRMAVLP
jgi:hypothetical protein